jgi:hypothetical protein
VSIIINNIMVSIRKAKQGFQLRTRRAGGILLGSANGLPASDREKIGLVVGGLCVGFLIVVLFQLGVFGDGGSDGGGGSNLSRQGKLESLRRTKQHPVLMEDITPDDNSVEGNVKTAVAGGTTSASQPQQSQRKRMDDRYNAAALDLIELLDCPKLLEEAVKSIKSYTTGGGFGGFGGEDNSGEDAERRRRLDEVAQQHGDDGGFGNEGGDEEAGGEAADPADEEGGTKDDDKELEDKWGDEAKAEAGGGGGGPNDDAPRFDDGLPIGGDGGGRGYYGSDLNAKHLFCLAASENPPPEVQNKFKCDAAGRKRRTLLDLWVDARAQIQDAKLLEKVLGLAQEHTDQTLLGRTYHIWAPENDDGLQFMLGSLNSDQVRNRFLRDVLCTVL